MDPANPMASALAVKSYKIVAVGSEEQVAELIEGAERVMDLGGKTVVPGFVDSHTHLTSAGVRSRDVDLANTKSITEVKKRLRQAIGSYSRDGWLLGFGWDESSWRVKRYLTARDLDEVSADIPMAIFRIDGHLATVNSAGLKLLGKKLTGEGVERDSEGRPTGVLKDMDDVFKEVRYRSENLIEGVVEGNKIANRNGITTAVDNVSAHYIKPIRRAETMGLLTTRMVINPPIELMKHMIGLGLTSGVGSPMFRLGGIKSFIDGSIGARTAYLSEDYADAPGEKGMLLFKERKFRKYVKDAVENDIQTVTHAIGDAAIEIVISAFEDINDKALIREQRHRIEHAEIINENQIRRAASLGLILSMQPNFVGQWQQRRGMYEERLGIERTSQLNMFRTILSNGARLCFGSDGMPYGPLYGIWCAINHPNEKERLTLEEALRCYTMEGAYSVFMERTIGSITPGKRADFVVLSKDIMRVPAAIIKDIEVDMTVVGGIVEFSKVKSQGG